jgi:hypothetical protein
MREGKELGYNGVRQREMREQKDKEAVASLP